MKQISCNYKVKEVAHLPPGREALLYRDSDGWKLNKFVCVHESELGRAIQIGHISSFAIMLVRLSYRPRNAEMEEIALCA